MFEEEQFSESELLSYRVFVNLLFDLLLELELSAKYVNDVEKISQNLQELYRNCMLEHYIQDIGFIVKCFVSGGFRYDDKKDKFPLSILRNFLNFYRSCTIDKRQIVLSNIHLRLDAVSRYIYDPEDDIPF